MDRRGCSMVKFCTTNRLFYCLILLVVMSALSMYWQSRRGEPLEEKRDEFLLRPDERDSSLKRVKRRLSPLWAAAVLPSQTPSRVISGYNETTQKRDRDNANDSGTIKTKPSGNVHVPLTVRNTSEEKFRTHSEHRNVNNDTSSQDNETLAIANYFVSDARLGSNPNLVTTTGVIILIHSGINQTLRRSTIRETWLTQAMLGNGHVSCMHWFVIGGKSANDEMRNSLRLEQEHYSDLLILWNVRNDYDELSLRSLHSMQHIYSHYQFQYMLKTDDDVFLNTPVIISEIQALSPRQRIYWGRFSCHNPPMEDGRWEERGWHWCDVYYPYAYGGLYILSHDVVQLVAENANSLQHYSCEDVSLGAWLAPYNLYRINDARIFVKHTTQCSRGYIAVHIHHRLSHKMMLKYYDNLKRKGTICSTLSKEDILLWEGLPHSCLNTTRVII